MTDYEQFPRYLPHQIKSVQIIEEYESQKKLVPIIEKWRMKSSISLEPPTILTEIVFNKSNSIQ